MIIGHRLLYLQRCPERHAYRAPLIEDAMSTPAKQRNKKSSMYCSIAELGWGSGLRQASRAGLTNPAAYSLIAQIEYPHSSFLTHAGHCRIRIANAALRRLAEPWLLVANQTETIVATAPRPAAIKWVYIPPTTAIPPALGRSRSSRPCYSRIWRLMPRMSG